MRLKKIVTWFFWTIFSVVCFLVLLTFLIQLPFIQNKLKNIAVNYLENTIKTEVALDRFYINFPNEIELDGLFLRDQKNDTLVYANSLRVSINLFDLLDNKADLTTVEANNLVSYISKDTVGNFNFDYIVDAFSNKDSLQVSKEPTSFTIDVGKISLQNIQISYLDQLEGNKINLKLKTLETIFEEFDLQELAFKTPKIKIDGLNLQAKLDSITKKTSADFADLNSTTKLPQIVIQQIDLSDFDVAYLDYNSNIDAKVYFSQLNSEIKKIDLSNLDFEVDKFNLDQAVIDLKLLATKKQEPIKSSKNDKKENTPQIALNQLNITNLSLDYSNLNEKKSNKGLDFNYLSFSKVDLHTENIFYNSDVIKANIQSSYFNEKSGLLIKNFSTLFNYNSSSLQLSNFKLKTLKSQIVNQTELRYKSLKDFTDNLDAIKIETEFVKSKLAISDLLLVAPNLDQQDVIKNNKKSVLYLDTKLSGTVNNLLISRLQFSGFGKSSIQAHGAIKNILEPQNIFVNIGLDELKTSDKDILALVPKNIIPENINLPEQVLVKGKVYGNTKDISTQLALQSTYGSANLEASYDQKKKGNENFDLKGNIEKFELGKFLKNDSIGKLSLSVNLKGSGLDPKLAKATFSSHISEFDLNGYLYQNIDLNGILDAGNYTANFCFFDVNAEVQLLASGTFADKYPTINLEGDINKLDLQQLKITTEPIGIETKFHANISDLDPENLNGKLRITDFKFINDKTIVPLDTIKVDVFSNTATNNFYFHSQVLDASVIGKYKIEDVATLFKQTLSNYFNISDINSEYIPTNNTFFTLNATVKNNNVLYRLLPELESFKTAKINAWYKANADAFSININLPDLIYGANNFSNIVFKTYTEDNKIDYNFSIENLQTSAYRIRNIALVGDAAKDQLNYLFTIKNKDLANQYKVEGSLNTSNNVFELKLNPKGLLLNYEAWQVASNNSIAWSNQGILAQNFKLTNNTSNLTIESTDNQFNAPLNVIFKDFKIEDITHIIKKDSLAARGIINGSIQFDDLKSDFDFTGNLAVSDLEYNEVKVGNLTLDVSKSPEKEDYLAAAKLLGHGNNVVLTGAYNTSKQTFSLQAIVNALQMETIQGFASNQISKTTGNVSGAMFLNGSENGLSVLGQVKFNDVGLTINTLNTPLKNINKSIVFNQEGIVFDNFEITDIENNKLKLDGKILTKNYQDFKFNLALNSKNFAVMNSTAKDNDLFYGKMYVDIDMLIKGSSTLPKVDGKISINKNTDFTFVLPSSDPSIADREGIVEFVNSTDFILNQEVEVDNQISQSNIKGLNLNAAISVSKDATLNIIIDKQHGDKLVLNGSAQLVGGVDTSGGTTLTGTYEIDSGSYDMTFNFIKRKFDIKKGSYIIWTGQPTSAIANITAIYRTNVAPIDLLSSQIQEMSDSEQNLYKQRIPVETLLELSGELLKPKLSFDIELPVNNYNVSSEVYSAVDEKLKQLRNDESEMNKQVIALLIFNRFIGTSSLGSAAGGSVSSLARQSVSDLVSEELNTIASHLVSGVDLNFDLDTSEDYSTGKKANRTDLNVQLSKRLFDDRLKITVGSNFGLEGQERENEQTTNIAGDISAEYMLTDDGRYMIRVYRKNTYQVAFQGQVVETGVTFIITMNYNTYKEYVRKNKEAREQRKIIKEQKKQNKTGNS